MSSTKIFVHLREVSALEDVRFREVPLFILFRIPKIKVKNFIVVIMLLNVFLLFVFHLSPFAIPFLYLLLSEEFLLFLGGSHLFGDSFFRF